MANSVPSPMPRDDRLDFFRGLALLIIFVAHIPDNWLAEYRPGAFGFSDSADIFVFVSGCAAALAYGKSFRRAGFLAGTARVVKRCAQLYASHLGLFFALAMICVAGNRFLPTAIDYIGQLNLGFFFDHPEEALPGLFVLKYVPNYFDILPIYIVFLVMLPIVMLVGRLHAALAVLVCITLYAGVPLFKWELPAEVAFERPWFFNPFAWQLLFFTGFFVKAGWLKTPSSRNWLTILCATFVLASVPLSHYPTYSEVGWLNAVRMYLEPFVNKTDLGVLRWLHFLCLAYLAVAILKGREQVLQSKLVAPIIKTGRQSLPVFLTGMTLACLAGMALDLWGRSALSVSVVNAAGIVILILTAYVVAWFKTQPWRSTTTP